MTTARLRVAVAGLWHETNTFAPSRTGVDGFRAYQWAEGQALVDRYAGVGNEVGGALEELDRSGAVTLPGLFAAAVPSGTVGAAAYAALRDRVVESVDPSADAVVLVMHGSMVAAGVDDVEADVAAAVRTRVGPRVPIAVTLDFHANTSRALVDTVDFLSGYRTYPHVDIADRGVEATAMALHMVTGWRPMAAHLRLPLLTTPLSQRTADDPMATITATARRWEEHPSVRSVTVAPGYAYADVPRAGFTITAYGDTREDAELVVRDLAGVVWESRERFQRHLATPADAVRRAGESARRPVVLVDIGDNIGGGAPGDGTVLLAELLARGVRGSVVVIADPAAVATATAAGEGALVHLRVGGHAGGCHGGPVPVTGTVRRLSDGTFVHVGAYMTGQSTHMGRTAVVATDNVEVVLTERPTMPFDPNQLLSVGIDPSTRSVVVVKAAVAWRTGVGDVAGDVIEVGTPGPCTADLAGLALNRVARPVYPLDDAADMAAMPVPLRTPV